MPSYLNQFGDYDACQTKLGYQYVFSSIHGIPRDYLFNVSIGSAGKYFPNGSVIGLCLPSSCPKWYIESQLNPIWTHLASQYGYSNISSNFVMST